MTTKEKRKFDHKLKLVWWHLIAEPFDRNAFAKKISSSNFKSFLIFTLPGQEKDEILSNARISIAFPFIVKSFKRIDDWQAETKKQEAGITVLELL